MRVSTSAFTMHPVFANLETPEASRGARDELRRELANSGYPVVADTVARSGSAGSQEQSREVCAPYASQKVTRACSAMVRRVDLRHDGHGGWHARHFRARG